MIVAHVRDADSVLSQSQGRSVVPSSTMVQPYKYEWVGTAHVQHATWTAHVRVTERRIIVGLL